MRAVSVLVVVLAGCTAFFGLRAAETVDGDSDGIEDAFDNCPDVPNPDQSDFDRDGIGDRCDVCEDGGTDDVDEDGILDGCDGCVGNRQDADRDGIDDNCDRCVDSGVDADGDGIDDVCDPCVNESGDDLDLDGIDDACDQCVASGIDADGDQIDDACDRCVTTNTTDADADGLEDVCDPCVSQIPGDTCGLCVDCLPCASASGFDEDRDTIDDGCDNCKLVPNLDQTDDADGDNVGVACDLGSGFGSGAVFGHNELFDGFNAASPRWYVQGSGWLITQGAANVSVAGQTFMLSGQVGVQFIVRANVRTAAGNTGAKVGVFVSSTQAQPAPAFMRCTLDPAPSPRVVLTVGSNGGSGVDHPGSAFTFDPAQVYQLVLSSNGYSVTCALRTTAPDAPVVQVGTTTLSRTGGAWFAGISGSGSGAVGHFWGYSVLQEGLVQ